MKTALLLIPKTEEHINRVEYLQLCIDKATTEGYLPFVPCDYLTSSESSIKEFVDKSISLVDCICLFIDFGVGKEMFDVIDRAVLAKIELVYLRSTKQDIINLHKSPYYILLDVCKRGKCSPELLKSKTRNREITDLRFVYFRRAKELSKASLAKIGEQVCRDHATVLHGISEANNQKAVVDIYNKFYGKASIKKTSLGQETGKEFNSQPVERPVLPYNSMDQREQGVPAAEPVMRTVPAGGYYNPFGGYRPHNT